MTGRGLVGRRNARAILVGALLLDGFAAVILLNQPGDIGPLISAPAPLSIVLLVPVIGVLLNLIGLAWMVRILRADPESHRSSWRAARRR